MLLVLEYSFSFKYYVTLREPNINTSSKSRMLACFLIGVYNETISFYLVKLKTGNNNLSRMDLKQLTNQAQLIRNTKSTKSQYLHVYDILWTVCMQMYYACVDYIHWSH